MAGLVALAGCGGTSNQVVARIDPGVVITRATLEHWMAVKSLERAVPDPPSYTACIARLRSSGEAGVDTIQLKRDCEGKYRALEQSTLGFLISSHWLVAEAAARGRGVSNEAVEQKLEQDERSFPDGEEEFKRYLDLTHETVADVKFNITEELATAALQQLLSEARQTVSQAQIARHYREHLGSYAQPDRRYATVFITTSRPAAMRVKRQLERAGSPSRVAGGEYIEYAKIRGRPTGSALGRAVFAARINVPVGPVASGKRYAVLEVTRIVIGAQRKLAQVAASIRDELVSEAQKKGTEAFVSAWRRRWIARTDCSPGFVVQTCRQYVTTSTSPREDPLALD